MCSENSQINNLLSVNMFYLILYQLVVYLFKFIVSRQSFYPAKTQSKGASTLHQYIDVNILIAHINVV